MDQLTHSAQRFAQAKESIFTLIGFLCSLFSAAFGVVLAISQYWRLWEFEDKAVRLVYIGLWKACYHQEFNISGTVTSILVYSPIDSAWSISPELQCAQNLILFAMLIKPIVVVLSSAAMDANIIKVAGPEFHMLCYKISVFILVLSSLCTAVSVTWNHVVDLYGKTTLDFPSTFPVKRASLIKKHGTHVFPIGILTSTLSLFAVLMFLFEIMSLNLQSKLKACSGKQADQ